MIDCRVIRLVDLVVLKDALDAAHDNMSTTQMMGCMSHYREVEKEMLSIAKELDKEFSTLSE